MIFKDKTFKYGNFMGLGFKLFIVINKDLFNSFGEKNIEILKEQLYKIFQAHEEFIEDGMSVGLRLLSKEEFPYGGQIRYWKKPELKKCHLNISAEVFAENPDKFYITLVHELTHWHDRAIVHRWNKSHLVSDREEVNLLSMILHSLRVDGLANLRMFYAKSTKNKLFDETPHKISMISHDVEVKLDFISYVLDFKARLTNFKKSLIKSEHPKELIIKWVTSQYIHFYFLGGVMCYFILFMHILKNGKEDDIQIFLDKEQKKRINVRKIKNYLHKKELYFGKVPLDTFKYTFSEIKKLKPAEFFILYLRASKYLGLNHEDLLIFDKLEREIIIKHIHEIDKEIE